MSRAEDDPAKSVVILREVGEEVILRMRESGKCSACSPFIAQ